VNFAAPSFANDYTGFDLETAAGVALPASNVRHVRFEIDNVFLLTASRWGISEIHFFEAAAAGNTYSDWISGYPDLSGQTGVDDDPDGDGNKNSIENYFGTDPGTFSQGLVSGTVTGNSFTFTHPQSSSPASDLTATYRWSTNLETFTADGDSQAGTTVDFTTEADSPVSGTTTVTATVSGTPVDKLFVEIEVTQIP